MRPSSFTRSRRHLEPTRSSNQRHVPHVNTKNTNPMEAFQSTWYRLVLVIVAIEATVLWFLVGPDSPWCAVTVVAGTFALEPAVAAPAMHRVPRHWFRVPAGERILHRVAGVGLFGWLLDITGWNRAVAKPMRSFSGNRAGLVHLEESLRGNVSAHGTCFAIHIVLAILGLLSEHPLRAALGMLLPGVVVHLYPVLLQRSIMLRLQPLLAADRPG